MACDSHAVRSARATGSRAAGGARVLRRVEPLRPPFSTRIVRSGAFGPRAGTRRHMRPRPLMSARRKPSFPRPGLQTESSFVPSEERCRRSKRESCLSSRSAHASLTSAHAGSLRTTTCEVPRDHSLADAPGYERRSTHSAHASRTNTRASPRLLTPAAALRGSALCVCVRDVA